MAVVPAILCKPRVSPYLYLRWPSRYSINYRQGRPSRSSSSTTRGSPLDHDTPTQRSDHAHYYNQHHPDREFAVGDEVLLSRRNLHTTSPTTKLDEPFVGPFPTTERYG
ncbi:hypothetical protein V1506DRAFT_544783 [Lipomyces tetrasporus]